MTEKVVKEQEEPLDFSSKMTSAGVALEGQRRFNHSVTSAFSRTRLETPQEKESRDNDVGASGSQRRERGHNWWMTSEGGRLGGNASTRPAQVHQPIEDSGQRRQSTRASKSVNRAREENHDKMGYSCRSSPEVAGFGDSGFDHLLNGHLAAVNGRTHRPNITLNSFNPGQSMGQQPVLRHHMQWCPSSPSTAYSTATPNVSNSVRQLPIDNGHNDSRPHLMPWLTSANPSFHHQLQQQQQQELLQQHARRPVIENRGLRPNYTTFLENYRSPRAFEASFTFDRLQSNHDDSGGRNVIRVVSPGTSKRSSTACSPTAFVNSQTQPLVSSSFPSPSTSRNCTNNSLAATPSSAAASPTDVVSRPTFNRSDSMGTMSSHSTTSSVVVNQSNSRPAAPMTTVTTEMRNSQSSRKRGRSPSEKLEDAEYKEKRRKNNEAAKRSRDARRANQQAIARRVADLERENIELQVEVGTLMRQNSQLRCWLFAPPRP